MRHHTESQLLIWDELRDGECNACELHQGVNRVCILGDGPVPCDVMVIGEAPGFSEDEKGMPFCGKAGIFLRKELKAIGLDPRKIFITNVVACRPPGNRTPKRKEAKTCASLYLVKQIERVKPKVVLLLGNTALGFLTGNKGGITSAEGKTITRDGIIYVPSRHPSSVVRLEEDPKEYHFVLQKFRENLRLFRRYIIPQDDGFEFSQDLPELSKDIPYVYTDLESDSLNPYRSQAKIHCLGFAQDPKKVSSFRSEKNKESCIKEILKTYPIIAHRTTFEGTWYRKKFGITPRIYHDTKVCAYIIDENEPSGLKYQATRYLKVEPWSEELEFDTDNFDFEKGLPYNARDNSYGLRLYLERDLPFLKKNPKVARLLRKIVYPAIEVFIDIIHNGYHIDSHEANKALKKCQKEMRRLNLKLNKIAGKEVNPGSPKQMSRLLYQQLRLECPLRNAPSKNNPEGSLSTSEAALIRLRGQHEATDILWDWRGWDKKRSTYLEPWIRQGPILHSNYGFTDTDTGRLNSSMVKTKRGEKKTGAVIHQCPRDPFIRNLVTPRGCTPDNYESWLNAVRNEIHGYRGEVPDPSKWCIIAGDLSQIELRLVAHCANEMTMIDIFNSGGDIHTATALDVLKTSADKIDKETRKKAKAVNFGFVYGMWAKKFVAYCLEKFDLRISQKDGRDYRRGYFRKYSGLEPWHNRVEATVRANGFIDSIFGRRRHLPIAKITGPETCPDCVKEVAQDCFFCGGTGYLSGSVPDEWIVREAVRQGINSPIQSAGSDLLLLIIGLVASQTTKWDFKIDRKWCFPVGSAHDSSLFECHRDYRKEMAEGLLWTVANLPLKSWFDIDFKVPILMDVNCYAREWEGEQLTLTD